jgi:hypothetical protein
VQRLWPSASAEHEVLLAALDEAIVAIVINCNNTLHVVTNNP